MLESSINSWIKCQYASINKYHNIKKDNLKILHKKKISFTNITILGSISTFQKHLSILELEMNIFRLNNNKIIKIYFYILYKFLLYYRVVYNFDKLKVVNDIIFNNCVRILSIKNRKNKSWVYRNIFMINKWSNIFTKDYIFKFRQNFINNKLFLT